VRCSGHPVRVRPPRLPLITDPERSVGHLLQVAGEVVTVRAVVTPDLIEILEVRMAGAAQQTAARRMIALLKRSMHATRCRREAIQRIVRVRISCVYSSR